MQSSRRIRCGGCGLAVSVRDFDHEELAKDPKVRACNECVLSRDPEAFPVVRAPFDIHFKTPPRPATAGASPSSKMSPATAAKTPKTPQSPIAQTPQRHGSASSTSSLRARVNNWLKTAEATSPIAHSTEPAESPHKPGKRGPKAKDSHISAEKSELIVQKEAPASPGSKLKAGTTKKYGRGTPPYIGALDVGTTSTRFMIFDVMGRPVVTHQIESTQTYPSPGWVQHSGRETIQIAEACMNAAIRDSGISAGDVKSIGVTNHRESTLAWDPLSGQPLSPIIVWNDMRTQETAEKMTSEHGGIDAFRSICGLPISTYFSGLKMKWLIDNVPAVRRAVNEHKIMFGTVDTWLIWNLTGGIHGGSYVTDVSNASRTMLMNVNTCKWDDNMLRLFGITKGMLPEIRSSSEVYGHVVSSGSLNGVPLAGCLGDQQAAMVGQHCFHPGQMKCTYGTGCFLLMNTGNKAVQSKSGLLTTVAYQLGPQAPVMYALEGSVAVGGSGVQWLRDNMKMISDAAETEELARSVPDTGDVYFVPAFSGLFAPRWRSDARGVLVGLTGFTRREHIVRAVLESVCYQTSDLVEAMYKDSKVEVKQMKVDGGMTSNKLVLETQADLMGVPVVKPPCPETTAMGAAFAAGLAVGVWRTQRDVEALRSNDDVEVTDSSISESERQQRRDRWSQAVDRSLGWAT